jgi:hypothetical protein
MPPLAVVHHDVLIERGPEPLRDDTGYDVGAAAGAERHDDGDWPARIPFRSCSRE